MSGSLLDKRCYNTVNGIGRKEEKVPPIFKALATITAWGLFIFAWVMGISAFAMGVYHADLFGTEATPVSYAIFWAVAGFYAIASVVVMLLRKKME